MKQILKEKIKNKGVSLIEMLVAVAIFGIIIGAISGIFISAIRTQRRVLATQELLDQTSYVLEYMGRAIRMVRKELNCINPNDPATCSSSNPPYCLTVNGYGYNYEWGPSGVITFIDYNGICTTYILKTGRINKITPTDCPATVPPTPPSCPLTSDKLQVNSFGINVTGESQTDTLQPRVTIFLKILGRGAVGEQPEIQIQTSISQRSLDVEY